MSVKFRGNTVHVCLLLLPVASAPTSVMAVQEGLTGIRVSWSPPTSLGDTTGYRIYYSGGSSGSTSEPVSGGSTNNYLLDNLLNGVVYTITMIVGTSEHLPSERVAVNMEVRLGKDWYMCSVVYSCTCTCTEWITPHPLWPHRNTFLVKWCFCKSY